MQTKTPRPQSQAQSLSELLFIVTPKKKKLKDIADELNAVHKNITLEKGFERQQDKINDKLIRFTQNMKEEEAVILEVDLTKEIEKRMGSALTEPVYVVEYEPEN